MSSATLKVATFNANSLRVRLPQILEWLAQNDIDLLGVQEIKVTDGDFPEREVRDAGYQVVYRGQKSYAGVAMLSREPLTEVSFDLGDGVIDPEPRVLRATYRGVRIINTYVPQGREVESEHFQYKLAWLGRVRAMLEAGYRAEESVLWMGDLNVAPEPIDVYDPKSLANEVDFHPQVREALAQVMAWGLVDVVRQHHPEPGIYSYWDYRVRNALQRNMGWRIDHLLASRPLAERCTTAWIDVEARKVERPSDHTFVACEFGL